MKDFKLKVSTRGKWLRADLWFAGKHYRYQIDLDKLYAALRRRIRQFEVAGEDIGWNIRKMWKKVKKGAKKLAKSKVWKLAEKATAMGSVLPPPYGPALAAASAGMKTTRALILARKHAKKGNKKKARRLVRAAKKVARQHPGMMGQAARTAKGPLYLALVR